MGSILKYKAKDFSEMVMNLVISKNIGYIEAVLEICDKHQIEPSSVNKLLNKQIKDKLKVEGQDINLLPKNKSQQII